MGGTLPSCNSLTSIPTLFHKPPLIFPPNSKLHPFPPRPHALKHTNLSTLNPISVSPIKIPKKVSFLGPINHSDIEVVHYSLSLLSIFFGEDSFSHDCKQFHGQFVKMGVINLDKFIQNKLVVLYSRSEEYLDDARKLFDEIPERDIPVYASLICSYFRSERWVELLDVFILMVNDGIVPDKYFVPTLLKAFAAMKMLKNGKMLHGFVVKNGMLGDVFVGNSLIDFYSNCGDLRYSRNVFDTMQKRDIVSWTALVYAYMDHENVDEAMNIFNSMEIKGVNPDLIFWNALISGLARNGEIDLALQYFEELKSRGFELEVSTWNGIISGCVQSGFFENAFDLFNEMIESQEQPNSVTIVSISMACSRLRNLKLGKAIHGYALKSKFLWNIHVEGCLINTYSKFGMIEYAEKVFFRAEKKNTALWNEIIAAYVNDGKFDTALKRVKLMVDRDSKPDEITYNTILSGYAKHRMKNEAYELLSEMTKMGLNPNIVTYNTLISGFQRYGSSHEALNLFRNIQSPNPITMTCTLAACADITSLKQGKEIHGYAIKSVFEPNIFVSSALIDMYAKCGDMKSATKVFSKIVDKNTISWNTLISGYVKDERPEEGFKLFSEMLFEGFIPSSITFMILIRVCGDLKELRVGRGLHGYILKLSLDIEIDDTLVSELVEMYAKCGCSEDARLVGDYMMWTESKL